MNRRRPLLRAFGMGGASLVVAGVLVAGVGVPANAVDLSIHSYRLSYPTSVTDSAGPSDAFAWRDVARDYSTRVPIAPASPVVQLGKAGAALYGTGAGLQLVHAGAGYSQRITGPDAWPASGGKPSHVLQSEWDACSGSSSSLVSSLRAIATGKLGGVNCPAVKASWGGKVGFDWTPIGGGGASTFPIERSTINEQTVTFGEPYWSSVEVPGTNANRGVWGWLYPVHTTFPAPAGSYVGLNYRWRAPDGTLDGAYAWGTAAPQFNLAGAAPAAPTSASASALPGSYCGGATVCLVASINRSAAAYQTRTAAGWDAVAVQFTFRGDTCTPSTYCHLQVNREDVSLPDYRPMLTGAPWTPADPGSVKLAITSTYADGSKVTCTSDGFLQKAGERIPLPCEPLPAAGHNYGPELSRTVELVPVTDTGYVYGSNPAREVAKVTPSQPIKDYAAAHPECATKRCTLDLVKSGVSCFDRPTGCENWKDEISTGTGHGYECKYGGKSVALSECDVYGPVFKSENRDAGHAYGPPAGGSGGETSAPHNPGAGPGGSECFPNGYGPANPVEHVLVPVTCALKDSLVPRGFVLGEAAGQVAAAADSVGVGKLGDALGSIGGVFDIGSQCVGGLPFRFELFGTVVADARIFDACQAPWDGIAPFVKNTLGALLLGSVVLAGARYLAAAFGFTGISTGIGHHVAQQQAASTPKTDK